MKICLRPRRPSQLGCRLPSIRRHDLIRVHPGFSQIGVQTGQRRARLWTRNFASGRSSSVAAELASQTVGGPSGDDLHRYWTLCPVPTGQRKDLDVWIGHLEQFLEPSEGGEKVTRNGKERIADQRNTSANTIPSEGHAIAALLFHARRLRNFDLLAHLGFKLGRWSDVHNLITKMLGTVDKLTELSQTVLEHPSNLTWPSSSMDTITDNSIQDYEPIVTTQSGSAASVTLDQLTEANVEHKYSRMIMSEIWQSLGYIVLEAADTPPAEAEMAMSYVFRALAHLHHSGIISDMIYKYLPPTDGTTSFRPPGLYLLSTHIMNVLSDAVWQVHQAEVSAKAKAAGEDSPYRSFKMGIRHLGNEIWLEFILWCCVEEGYVKEAIWVLERMKAREGGQAWKLMSWRPLLQTPDLIRNTKVDSVDFWPHPEALRTDDELENRSGFFHGLGKRTISLEVVTALSDTVVSFIDQGVGSKGYSVLLIIQYLAFLDSLAVRFSHETSRRPDGFPARHIVRVLESQGIDPHVEPRSLERLLRARAPVLPPWDDSVPTEHDKLESIDQMQIHGTSSALTGLLEANIQIFSQQRQIGRAFNLFAWLQELVDMTKMQHVQQFLDKVQNMEVDTLPSEDEVPTLPVPINISSIPQLSSGTLADLLDLAIVSRAYGFGEWLLFSTDADGAPIPFAAYGDQALAPAIIRFAAATRNTALCDKVVESLRGPISRNSIKALINFRIVMGDWDRIELMLNYLRDHKHKTWGESNVTVLAAAILKMDRSVHNKSLSDPERRQKSLAHAKDLLRRILSGEFNPRVKFDMRHGAYYDRVLYRLHQIFSSIPGPLEEICHATHLQYCDSLRRDTLPMLSSVAFHNLLDTVVDLHGSAAGKRLWDRWCVDMESPLAQHRTEDGIHLLHTHQNWNVTSGNPHPFDPGWLCETQEKAVIPNLNTVRIIARVAVREYMQLQQRGRPSPAETDDEETRGRRHDGGSSSIEKVLDFCVQRFRRLRLDEKEIDRETNGHNARMEKREARPATSADEISKMKKPFSPF